MKKYESLTIRVGPKAYQEIEVNGLDIKKIKTIMGASGGPKWLVLSHLDKLIIDKILPRLEGPVHLISSSISSWRFVCYAQKDPLKAIKNFEYGYINQYLPKKYKKGFLNVRLREMFDELCPSEALEDVINHSLFRTNIITSSSSHILKSEFNPILLSGLLLAYLANAVSRNALGHFFSRAIFEDHRNPIKILEKRHFATERIDLSVDNLKDVVIASSSIPIFLVGVKDIQGAPKGSYRDGGLTDYHFDFSVDNHEGYVLYPHFFDFLKPSWFDRSLSWRRVNPHNHARTIMICPSEKFIDNLPGSKVPDRNDFSLMTNKQRVKVWNSVVSSCERLADDFNEIIEHQYLPRLMKPF